jgi:hypothetical protein
LLIKLSTIIAQELLFAALFAYSSGLHPILPETLIHNKYLKAAISSFEHYQSDGVKITLGRGYKYGILLENHYLPLVSK